MSEIVEPQSRDLRPRGKDGKPISDEEWAEIWAGLPEQCEECESAGVNCSWHDGPEWREEEQ